MSIQSLNLPLTSSRGEVKKIILIVVAVIVVALGLTFLFKSGVTGIVKNQLDDIKSGKLHQAYEMTSADFQQATSFNDFKNYINQYTIFSNYKKINITEKNVESSAAYIKGTLEGENGDQMQIEYQLIKEFKQWKIQGMRLSPAGLLADLNGKTVEKDSTGASIFKVLINDTADKSGYVKEDKTTLPKSAPKIYVTFYVIAPKEGIKIQTMLVHLPDGAGIGPVTGDITKSGNVMKAFTFTRTQKAWPTGKYEIRAVLSSGATRVAKFDVK